MHNLESVRENENHIFLWGFEIQTDHLILAITTRPSDSQGKKRICRIVDFAVPADHRIKLNENEKER